MLVYHCVLFAENSQFPARLIPCAHMVLQPPSFNPKLVPNNSPLSLVSLYNEGCWSILHEASLHSHKPFFPQSPCAHTHLWPLCICCSTMTSFLQPSWACTGLQSFPLPWLLCCASQGLSHHPWHPHAPYLGLLLLNNPCVLGLWWQLWLLELSISDKFI